MSNQITPEVEASKTNSRTTLSISIPAHERLRTIANRDRYQISGLAERLIMEGLDRLDSGNPSPRRKHAASA